MANGEILGITASSFASCTPDPEGGKGVEEAADEDESWNYKQPHGTAI